MLFRRIQGHPVLHHQFDTKTFERVFLLNEGLVGTHPIRLASVSLIGRSLMEANAKRTR